MSARLLMTALLCCSGFAFGCAGTTLTPKTEVPRPQGGTASGTMVVGEITRPRELVVAAGNPFYAAMQRELMKELDKAQLASKLMDERDLPEAGVQGKTFGLRYRVVEDVVVVTSTGGGCFATLLITGSLTLIPLFFIGLCTMDAEHRMTVEARVFDVSEAKVSKVRDATSNEMLNVYDTSTLSPILRREYPVKVTVTKRVGKVMDGEETLKLAREEAQEVVRQILAASMTDISRAVKR